MKMVYNYIIFPWTEIDKKKVDIQCFFKFE